jgi:hypothetical protein
MIRMRFAFPEGREQTEEAVLATDSDLRQLAWSWTEERGGKVLRDYHVDFQTGQARAMKLNEGDRASYELVSEKFTDIVPGKTFAGIGMSVAIKNLAPRLARGEEIELQAIAFTPGPRMVGLKIASKGEEPLKVGAGTKAALRIEMHPEVPFIAKLFKKVRDLELWLDRESPHEILRFQGSLPEPDDPLVRMDTYPSTARASG